MIYLKNGDIKEVQAALSEYLADEEQMEQFENLLNPIWRGNDSVKEELKAVFGEGTKFYSQTENSFVFAYGGDYICNCKAFCKHIHAAFQRLKKQFPELVIHESARVADSYATWLAVYSAEADSKEVEMEWGARCEKCGKIVPLRNFLRFNRPVAEFDDNGELGGICSITCAVKVLCDAERWDEDDIESIEGEIQYILKNQPEKYLNQDNIDELIEICKDRIDLREELIDAYRRVNKPVNTEL